jgi:hypothetical protein
MHKRQGNCVPGKCEEGGLEALMGGLDMLAGDPSLPTPTAPALTLHDSITAFYFLSYIVLMSTK